MSKVIVIGGGASGLTAAIYASLAGNEVIILEKNANCGKKILITGNGRCNYYNSDQNVEHFHTTSNIGLEKILNKNIYNEINNFFEMLGLVPKIKDGYYYPLSNQAVSVANALLNQAELLNVEIRNNINVDSISKENNLFKITTDYENFDCDKVILATGSKAAPSTGSVGIGYDILKTLGHNIITPLPALVQLISDDKIVKEWAGVRNEADCTLIVNDSKIKSEIGEIMLTDYGVSGICIFNLSGEAAKALYKKQNVEIEINFIPNIIVQDYYEWFNNYNKNVPNRKVSELLDNLINYNLVNAILKKLNIKRDICWNDLTYDKQNTLIDNLTKYRLLITDTKSFDKAQVCSGGLSLEEVDLNTLESKKISNLFIAGELLDVDGDCGGYNLTWAWASGILAGKGTKDND